MAKFKVSKQLRATWENVEAETITDAVMKVRSLVPDKQFVLESRAKRLK